MPKIPQYVSNERPLQASDLGEQATAEAARQTERYARTQGEVVNQIGGVAQGLVKQAEQQTAQTETADLYQKMANLTAQAHQSLTQTLNNADPTDQDTLQKWNDSYLQPKLAEMGDGLMTRQAQLEFQKASAGLTMNLTDRGAGEWDSLQKQHVATSVQQTSISLGNAAVSDPASLPSILQQSDNSVNAFVNASGGRVSKEAGTALALNARSHIADTAAESLVKQAIDNPNFNPEMGRQLATQLASPMFTDNMSPEKRAQLLGVLSKAHDTQLIAQSSIFKSRVPAMLDQIKLTGTSSQFDAGIQNFHAKTAEETVVGRQELVDQRNSAMAYYHVSQDAGLVPQQDEAAYLTQRESELRYASPDQVRAADEAHKQAQQFFTDRDKAFTSGTQAQFLVDHNETLKAYQQDFSVTPTAQNFERYASYSEAVQHHLYPDAPTHLLTPGITADISQTMHNLTQAGAPQVESALKGYSQKYGAYWPQLATEAMEKGAMTEAQYVGAQLYNNPANYGLSAQVLKSSVMSQKDLQATADAAAGGTGIISMSGARAAAAAAFAPFAKTLGNAANGDKIMSAYTDAAARVLMMNGSTSGADKIASQMLTGMYTVQDTVRIPNWQGIDTKAVQWALSDTSRLVDWGSVVVPPAYSGLGPKDQKTNYVSQLQSTAQWHTNQDESGVTLYDENGYNVLTMKNGKPTPITLTWKQLQDDAGKNEGILSKVWGAL